MIYVTVVVTAIELVKIPCTLFILDASLLAGQKRHFEGGLILDFTYIFSLENVC